MNRKFKGILATGCSALIATMAYTHIVASDESAFCSNSESIQFNHQLPKTHPVNQCAIQQQSDISWLNWLSGRSKSYQFHYLDLLELLSRHADESTQNRLR